MIKKQKISQKLINYLDKEKVKYDILEHRTVYTAIDAAMTLKKKINEIAKSIFVKADSDYYIVLLSADQNLDFKKLAKTIEKSSGKKIKSIKIPTENLMKKALKIKIGAASAFGSLQKMPVIVEKGLVKTKKAIFSSGSFNHSIQMGMREFIKLENAVVGAFGIKKKIKIQKKKS